MKNIEYYNRMAKELYDRAYSDGYEDGMRMRKLRAGFANGIRFNRLTAIYTRT